MVSKPTTSNAIRKIYNIAGAIGPEAREPFTGSAQQWIDQLVTAATDCAMNGFVFWLTTDHDNRRSRFHRASGDTSIARATRCPHDLITAVISGNPTTSCPCPTDPGVQREQDARKHCRSGTGRGPGAVAGHTGNSGSISSHKRSSTSRGLPATNETTPIIVSPSAPGSMRRPSIGLPASKGAVCVSAAAGHRVRRPERWEEKLQLRASVRLPDG